MGAKEKLKKFETPPLKHSRSRKPETTGTHGCIVNVTPLSQLPPARRLTYARVGDTDSSYEKHYRLEPTVDVHPIRKRRAAKVETRMLKEAPLKTKRRKLPLMSAATESVPHLDSCSEGTTVFPTLYDRLSPESLLKVLKGLSEDQRQDLVETTSFNGPLLFLLLFYVDRFEHIKQRVTRQFPILKGWTRQLLAQRQADEENSGAYGKGRQVLPVYEELQQHGQNGDPKKSKETDEKTEQVDSKMQKEKEHVDNKTAKDRDNEKEDEMIKDVNQLNIPSFSQDTFLENPSVIEELESDPAVVDALQRCKSAKRMRMNFDLDWERQKKEEGWPNFYVLAEELEEADPSSNKNSPTECQHEVCDISPKNEKYMSER